MIILIAVLFFIIGAIMGSIIALRYHKQDKAAYSVLLRKLIRGGNLDQTVRLLLSYE